MFYLWDRLQTAIVPKLVMFYRIWKDMTLIEYLVVLAIIALCIGIIIPSVPRGCGSPELWTSSKMNGILQYAEVHRSEIGHWPTQSELYSYTASDPYFSFDDFWKRPIIYTLLPNGVQVHSLGRDPKDPADDITKTVTDPP